VVVSSCLEERQEGELLRVAQIAFCLPKEPEQSISRQNTMTETKHLHRLYRKRLLLLVSTLQDILESEMIVRGGRVGKMMADIKGERRYLIAKLVATESKL
jgi:hypothetical protein